MANGSCLFLISVPQSSSVLYDHMAMSSIYRYMHQILVIGRFLFYNDGAVWQSCLLINRNYRIARIYQRRRTWAEIDDGPDMVCVMSAIGSTGDASRPVIAR